MMPCISPLNGWFTHEGLTFVRPSGPDLQALNYDHVQVPCRNCIGCKIDRSKEWAVRIMHESELHDENMFITLTYDEEHLPEDQGLHHEHFQAFMKKLRRYAEYHHDKKISYYMCGEYGDRFGRPHYHAIIFGLDMPDKKHYGKLYGSEKLTKLWDMGFVSIGSVSMESAAYVARYIMKKVTGDQAEKHYVKAFVDEETGEIVEKFTVEPEYNRMSLKPAIGKRWFEQYQNDFGEDPENQQCHINGKKFPLPKYYLERLKAQDPDKYEAVLEARKQHAANNQPTERQLLERKRQYESRQFKRKLK